MDTDLSSFPARVVSVEARIGNVLFPVSRLEMSHSMGQLPTTTFYAQLDNQKSASALKEMLGSVDIDVRRVGNLNRIIQEKILNQFRLTPDVEITINDGDGHKVVHRGFLGKPATSVANGRVSIQFSTVHPAAALQAFTPAIYSSQEYYGSVGFASTTLAQADPFSHIDALQTSKSIAERVLLITEEIRSHYVATSDLVEGEFRALPIHNLNEKAWPLVKKVLNDSLAPTVIRGIDDPNNITYALHENIYNALVSTPDMLQALQAIAAMFFFQINATWDGTFILERLQPLDPPGKRLIDVPLQNFDFSMAHLYEIPLVQVLVQGEGSEYYGLEGSFGIKYSDSSTIQEINQEDAIHAARASELVALKALVAYPPKIDKNKMGRYFILNAPNWIGRASFFQKDAQRDLIEGMERYEGYINRASWAGDKLKQQLAARKHIMEWIAEQAFKDQYLRNCGGNITAPLNLALQVGRTYRVVSQGDQVFTGYLRGVNHVISVTADGGEAWSSLAFSHTRAPGAYLQPIDDPEFIGPQPPAIR